MRKCKKCLVCEAKTKQKFMKFLRLDVIPNVPGGGWVEAGCPWVSGWRRACWAGARRSHFKNQQLLTLNMVIFIVCRGWRLPAFRRGFLSFWLYCWMPMGRQSVHWPSAHIHPHTYKTIASRLSTRLYTNTTWFQSVEQVEIYLSNISFDYRLRR